MFQPKNGLILVSIGLNITFFFLSGTPTSIVLYERKDKNLSLVAPVLICTKKAVQIKFVCVVPIFSSTLQKLRIFPKYKQFFNKNSVLGAVSSSSQERFCLGCHNLQRPRGIEKKSLKIGKVRSFCKVLKK